MYALLIPRQIKPDHKEHFIDNLKEHGRESKASEPDSKRYEFYQDPDDTNRIWLYDAYADKAALGVHVKGAPHIQAMEAIKECGCEEERPEGGFMRADSIWSFETEEG
jgi:autoinducer 2-degrading protein